MNFFLSEASRDIKFRSRHSSETMVFLTYCCLRISRQLLSGELDDEPAKSWDTPACAEPSTGSGAFTVGAESTFSHRDEAK